MVPVKRFLAILLAVGLICAAGIMSSCSKEGDSKGSETTVASEGENTAEGSKSEGNSGGDGSAASEGENTAEGSKSEGNSGGDGSAGASPENKPAETEPIKVEVGTTVEYKMANYLDEAKDANPDDTERNNIFVQNITRGFARIDDEFMLNDEDTYQLFWAAVEPGNTFTVPFEIPASGKYKVSATLFNGGDFITCQIFIGDQLITGNQDLDCFNSNGGLYDFDFGSFDLKAGKTELTVKCTGKNDSSAGYVFAINSLRLTCEALS